MTIPKLSPFDLSSINSSDVSGLDGSEKTRNTIYIGLENTSHVIALKPFVENIKYNLTKELEYMSDKDKWEKVIKEYTGDFTIDLDLKLPASSPKEARNNVGKIEHLQKMLLEPYSAIGEFINNNEEHHVGPLFFVSFVNLIFGQGPIGSDLAIDQLADELFFHGFPCTIKSISYKPDVKMGFFEFDSPDKQYLYPKLLDLTLTLSFENNNRSEDALPLKGFTRGGDLQAGDFGNFPFDVITNYRYSDVANAIKSEINYNSRNYYIYLFRDNVTALFPAFIEDFSRDFEVENNVVESKSKYIGKGIDTGKFSTPQKLSYKVVFSVPCANIEQSKIFCSEVAKLMRMFYRPQETDEAISRDPFKVYIPGFIEGPNDSQSFSDILAPGALNTAPPETTMSVEETLRLTGFNTIEEALAGGDEEEGGPPALIVEDDRDVAAVKHEPPGIYLFMEDLGIEMMHDMGFFDDSTDGYLFPKAFKVTIGLVSDYSHKYESSIKPFKVEVDRSASHESELFPFNRKTFKIGE
jgi:hypothetical protein